MLMNSPTIYNELGLYKGGSAGGVVSFEKVFYTKFSNLVNGTDTPDIGVAYSTVLSRYTGQVTPLTTVTSTGRVDSNPNGGKLLIDFEDYTRGKKRAILEFLVRVVSSVSYSTNVVYTTYSPQIWLQNSVSSGDSCIRLLTGDATGVYVRNSVFNNRVQLEPFVAGYSKDGWIPVKYEYDFENKVDVLYLYGIKTYTKSFDTASPLQLWVSLWDGVTLEFTDVSLWVL